MELIDRFKGSLVGLACGDALGATLEFKARGTFEPISDIIGGGFAKLKAGEWTDDTAMMCCLASSLIEKGFNLEDQIDKYCKWVYDGYWQKNGQRFIGLATYDALRKYKTHKTVLAGSSLPNKAGNGSIMRLAPVALFSYPNFEQSVINCAESSKTTHASIECIEACMLLGAMIHKALEGKTKEEILSNHNLILSSPNIVSIQNGDYFNKKEEEILGSGYVVKSLEASLWCFNKTNSFKESVCLAANLGDDSDTTAAIVGQIAGAYYGLSGIPSEWVSKLDKGTEIIELAENLYKSK